MPSNNYHEAEPRDYGEIKIMTTEFENLLRLLSSTDEVNVRLGFQLAHNYEAEFETHFGRSRQAMEELFGFLMKYRGWDFKTAFWEITHLELSENKLQNLPDGIWRLQKLIYLDLTYNHLQTLPTEIGLLKSLSQLRLGNNQLKALPTEIGELESLYFLTLENNKLQNLPAEIGKLKRLGYLELKNNKLKNLPAEIGQLQSLVQLNLSKNPLKALPEELCNLENTLIFIQKNRKGIYIPEKLEDMDILRCG